MKTIDIINHITEEVDKYNFLYVHNFDEWLEVNKNNIQQLYESIDGDIQKFIPIRNEVWKLVYKKVYSEMPFSKEYILNHYRHYEKNTPYVVYPSKNKNPKLIVSFSGYIDYESYSRLSWWWDRKENWKDEYVYLFLNDLDKSWYVGTPQKPKKKIYIDIIDKVKDEYGIFYKDIYLIGSSMGAYASILFGIMLNVGGGNSRPPSINKKISNEI